jgi:transcriptional regulator with PAS, ATPase and Fis domain
MVTDGSHIAARSKERTSLSPVLRNGGKTRYNFGNLIGRSAIFQRSIATARDAGSELPVLISGETGTGKELFAQAIHSSSSRCAGPFVAINCAAIPRDLAAAELFGFEPGTFTGGAKDGRIGKFEQAHGGTIFLDEIGDMSLELQVLLLRVLEEREVTPLGGRKTIPVDVRVIAATNQDLVSAIELRTFRKDLFYRLNVIRIHVPPLRERAEDIDELLTHFLVEAARECGEMSVAPQVTREALKVLQAYTWPGNIRELKNVAERLSTRRGTQIVVDDLPHELRTSNQLPTSATRDGALLKVQEAEIIRTTLEQCAGNMAEAARRLGINRSTIYRRLRRC